MTRSQDACSICGSDIPSDWCIMCGVPEDSARPGRPKLTLIVGGAR